MKSLLLAGVSLVVLSATAGATPTTFGFTGGFQTFTTPATGLYDILAFGAQGGTGNPGGGVDISANHLGAEIGGQFTLTAGEMLTIAIGGKGGDATSSTGGGGGGGSFVVGPGNTP